MYRNTQNHHNLRVLPSVISSSLEVGVYAIGSVASAPDELIGVLPLRLLPKSLRRRFDARPFIHGRSMRYFPNTTTPLEAIDVAAANEFIKPATIVFPIVVRGDVRFDVCPVAVQIDRNVGQTVLRNFVRGPGAERSARSRVLLMSSPVKRFFPKPSLWSLK